MSELYLINAVWSTVTICIGYKCFVIMIVRLPSLQAQRPSIPQSNGKTLITNPKTPPSTPASIAKKEHTKFIKKKKHSSLDKRTTNAPHKTQTSTPYSDPT